MAVMRDTCDRVAAMSEDDIVWLEDTSGLLFVRETVCFANTRRRPVPFRASGTRVVGYARLRADAPNCSNMPRLWRRRVFWVRDSDAVVTRERPCGVPNEAVDSQSVPPGVYGRRVAENCQPVHEGRVK